MVDSVQQYLQEKESRTNKAGLKTEVDSGVMTTIGAALTPFRIGTEAITAAILRLQDSRLSLSQAYDLARGNREGKEWWEEGEGRVATIGQAVTDLVDPSNVDFSKLKGYQDKKFSSGPRKYASGSLDAVASVFLDPVNFLTFGTVAAAAKGAQVGLRSAARKLPPVYAMTMDESARQMAARANILDRASMFSPTSAGIPVPENLENEFFNNLRRATPGNQIGIDDFDNPEEYFALLNNALAAKGNKEAVLGSPVYKDTVKRILPYFSTSPKNASFPLSLGKNATYFDSGPFGFGVKDNVLWKFNPAKNKWESMPTVNPEVMEYLTKPKTMDESTLDSYVDFFEDAPENSYAWAIGTPTGEPLTYTQGSSVGSFTGGNGEVFTVLVRPDERGSFEHYVLSKIPVERQPVDESVYTPNEIDVIDSQITEFEALEYAWDKTKFFDDKEVWFDKKTGLQNGNASDFQSAEDFNPFEPFPEDSAKAQALFDFIYNVRSIGDRPGDYVMKPKSREGVEKLYLAADGGKDEPVIYEAVLTKSKKSGKGTVVFNRLEFAADGTITPVAVVKPKVKKEKLDLGEDYEPVSTSNPAAVSQRMDLLRSNRDEVEDVPFTEEEPLSAMEGAFNDALDKLDVEQTVNDPEFSYVIDDDLEVIGKPVRSGKYMDEDLPEEDLAGYDYRWVRLKPSDLTAFNNAVIKYKDAFGAERTSLVPLDYVRQAEPIKIGKANYPIFKKDGEFFAFGLSGELLPLNKAKEAIRRYEILKAKAEDAIALGTNNRIQRQLTENERLLKEVKENPAMHLVRLQGALTRAKAARSRTQGPLKVAYHQTVVKLESQIKDVIERTKPQYLESVLEQLRNNPEFVAKYNAGRDSWGLVQEEELAKQAVADLKQQYEAALRFMEKERWTMEDVYIKNPEMAKFLASYDSSIAEAKSNLRGIQEELIPLRDSVEAVRSIDDLKARIAEYNPETLSRELNQEIQPRSTQTEVDPRDLWDNEEDIWESIHTYENAKHFDNVQKVIDLYESEGRRKINIELGYEIDFDPMGRLRVQLVMQDVHKDGFAEGAATLKTRRTVLRAWEFPRESFEDLVEWASPIWNSQVKSRTWNPETNKYESTLESSLHHKGRRIFPNLLKKDRESGEYILNDFFTDQIGISKIDKTPTGSTEPEFNIDTGEIVTEEMFPIYVGIDEMNMIGQKRFNAYAMLNPKAYIVRERVHVQNTYNAILRQLSDPNIPASMREDLEDDAELFQWLVDNAMAIEDPTELKDWDQYSARLVNYHLIRDPEIPIPTIRSTGSFREKALVQLFNDLSTNRNWDKYRVEESEILSGIKDFRDFANMLTDNKNLIKHVQVERILEEEATLRGAQARVKAQADEGISSNLISENRNKADREAFSRMFSAVLRRAKNEPDIPMFSSTTSAINSFRNENAFLSNMSSSPITIDGITYPTAEHAFQAFKTNDSSVREWIASLETPAKAKKAGRTIELIPNWDEQKVKVMERIVRQKFKQNPELKQKLIETGDAELIEGNTWGDKFWGKVDGEGENNLGQILMRLRTEFIGKKPLSKSNSTVTETPKEVFVFGSNLAGRHGKGAALEAKNKYGAEYGNGVGPQGQAYAIPTKGKNLEKLTPQQIKPYVDEFVAYVKANPDTTFNLTDIGLGLADNKPEDIAALFDEVPSNIAFITPNSRLKAAIDAKGSVATSGTEVVTRASNKNAVKEIVDAGGVYIGRNSATYNYPGFYGNPYVVQGGKVKKAVDAYETDLVSVLRGNPIPDSQVVKYYKDKYKVDVTTPEGRDRLVERIKQLDGKRIVCAGTEPADQCHGNVLVKVLEMIKNGEI